MDGKGTQFRDRSLADHNRCDALPSRLRSFPFLNWTNIRKALAPGFIRKPSVNLMELYAALTSDDRVALLLHAERFAVLRDSGTIRCMNVQQQPTNIVADVRLLSPHHKKWLS